MPELYDMLGELGNAISLVNTAERGLERQSVAADEMATLKVAGRILSEVQHHLREVAEKKEPLPEVRERDTLIYHFTDVEDIMHTVQYLRCVVSVFERARIDLGVEAQSNAG